MLLQSFYNFIAFEERVTFWLQRARLLPCACGYVALFARRLGYNHHAITHAHNAANVHAQGSDRCVEAKKLLSHRRQLQYRAVMGNLFTTAGQKRVVIFVAGHTHNSRKVHIIFIHIIFFPSKGLAGRTRIACVPHAAHRPQVAHPVLEGIIGEGKACPQG